MKAIGSLFLIFTIIYTTIGVRINAHHCETKNSTSYSIFEDNNCCPKDASKCPLHQQQDDCCSDKTSLVHLGQDIHFYPDVITPNPSLITLLVTNYSFALLLPIQLQTKGAKGREPPIIFKQEDKQAINQVYII